LYVALLLAIAADGTYHLMNEHIHRGLLALAMALAALALLACQRAQVDPPAKPTAVLHASDDPVDALRRMEAVIGIQLPPGTTVIQHAGASDSDALLRAKLAMGPEQFSTFLSTLSLTTDAFEDDKRYLLGTNDGWWNPEDPAALLTAQLQLRDAEVLNIGVDRTDPQRPLVFLLWHGT
jgi:hypothetical protein